MINPFRSEAEAFRVVVASAIYFGAIAVAAGVGGRWWGIGVFVVLSAAVLGWWLRARRQEAPLQTATPRRSAEGERRILVVANETVGGEALREMIHEKAEGYREEVLVVTPALNSPLRHWVSDEDDARAAAQRRLNESLARLLDDTALQPVRAAFGVCRDDDFVRAERP